MMKKVNYLLLSISLMTLSVRGFAANKLSDYYLHVYLGEKKTSNYIGPYDARGVFKDNVGGMVFLDDIFYRDFFNQQSQYEAFDLYNYWNEEVIEKSSCPDETLSEHIEYIRYLYRLVSISYLFESTKLNTQLSNQLGVMNSCSLSFKSVMGKCTPKTQEMKKFHTRAFGKFENEIKKIHHPLFNQKEKEEFLASFEKSNSLTSNPIYARLHHWCRTNGKNCKNLKTEDISKALGSFCQSDASAIELACSENDDYYGISQSDIPTNLILNSNVFDLINKTGTGQECLRRFTKVFKTQEIPNYNLVRQFPLIYSHLLEQKSRYMQGDLFVPGALKEFDNKGLSDFLTALRPPKEVPVVVRPKVVVEPAPKPKVIAVIETRPVEKEVVVPVVEVVPEVKVSEFENKVAIFKSTKKNTDINMQLFSDDFSFTEEMIAAIQGPIRKFQTRQALMEMKSYDSLGSKQAPVGLIFIKYLIDSNNHQGLYNIVSVIGEKFYVFNDIEEGDESHLIQLTNDQSTNNKWQISLVIK